MHALVVPVSPYLLVVASCWIITVWEWVNAIPMDDQHPRPNIRSVLVTRNYVINWTEICIRSVVNLPHDHSFYPQISIRPKWSHQICPVGVRGSRWETGGVIVGKWISH